MYLKYFDKKNSRRLPSTLNSSKEPIKKCSVTIHFVLKIHQELYIPAYNNFSSKKSVTKNISSLYVLLLVLLKLTPPQNPAFGPDMMMMRCADSCRDLGMR